MMILVCKTRHGNIGDRILGLAHRAYPGMTPDWMQGLSVPAFLKGLKDKVSGQEAMKFGKLQTVTDAVEQAMNIQCTAPVSTRLLFLRIAHIRCSPWGLDMTFVK